VNNPHVGKNLQDHYVAGIMMEINKISFHLLDENIVELLKSVGEYLVYRTGLLESNGAEINGLFHSEIAKNNNEKLPDFQIVGIPALYDEHSLIPHPGLHGFSLGAVLLRPKSTGYIALNSNNPYDHPLIDPQYFSDEEGDDMKRLVSAFKLFRRLVNTPPLSEIVLSEVVPGSNYTTDEDVAYILKKKGITLYHPVGTAAIGKVTDNELRVIGIENLRVVDASVMPKLIGANTNIPTIMIAEKAADLIKHQYEK
jgi:choline dehydrogenase